MDNFLLVVLAIMLICLIAYYVIVLDDRDRKKINSIVCYLFAKKYSS